MQLKRYAFASVLFGDNRGFVLFGAITSVVALFLFGGEIGLEIQAVKKEIKTFASRLRAIIRKIKRTSAYYEDPEELAELQDDILACHFTVKEFLEKNQGQYDEMSSDAVFLREACWSLRSAARDILHYEMIIKSELELDMLRDVVENLTDLVN